MAAFLRALLALVVAAVLGGLAFIYSGLFDVSAVSPHMDPVRWALDTTFQRSVERRADEIVPPADLGGPQRVQAGAQTYAAMCVHCHGAVGEPQPRMAQHMRPQPPDLAQAAPEWSAGELYWIVSRGVKMTGMPAFGPIRDEDTLWSVVAFVQRMPGMAPETYQELTGAPQGQQQEAEGQQQAQAQAQQQDGAQEQAPAAATVNMTGSLNYEPRSVTVRAGQAVEWVNTSQVPHTVTADASKANDPQHVRLPQGAEPFHSGTIGPGERYRRVFTVPGRYQYFCVPHEGAGMVGELVVQ